MLSIYPIAKLPIYQIPLEYRRSPAISWGFIFQRAFWRQSTLRRSRIVVDFSGRIKYERLGSAAYWHATLHGVMLGPCIAFWKNAQALEMRCVRPFPFIQDRYQFSVGLCANPANQVLHSAQAVTLEIVDLQQGLQPLDGFFKSAVHVSNGLVDMGPYRHLFGGFWIGVKVGAL